jgi:hypothetical protein
VFVHDQLGELVLIGLATREVGDADLLDRHGCLLGQGWQSIASERGVPGLHAPLAQDLGRLRDNDPIARQIATSARLEGCRRR